MATHVVSTSPDTSTDANFRAWGSQFNGVWTVGGFWLQTADTGQINWTTVLHPTVDRQSQGYEIYKSNDALSSTFPVYMKVEYGQGRNNAGGIWLTFGTGTDGAGNLNQTVSTRYGLCAGAAAPPAGQINSSGGTGYFSSLIWVTAVNTGFAISFVIERSKDSNGNYTSDYVTWVLAFDEDVNGVRQNSQRTMFNPTKGVFSTEITDNFSLFVNAATAAQGSFASPFPVFPFLGYADNPMTAIMGMKSGDIADLGTFTVVVYGVTHTYLWSNRGFIAFGGSTGMTNTGVGIRFE